MSNQDLFIRKSSGLTRQISARDALVYAAMNPGLLFSMVYIIWTPYLYPGANMPLAVLAVLQMLPISGLYWFFSVAMPRSGGEYIYVSRVLHPCLGLVVSFVISFTALSWLGIQQDWWMKWALSDCFKTLGLLYHNAALTSIGNFFTLAWVRTILGTISLIFIGFLFMKGAKTMMKLSYVTIACCVLGLVAFAVAASHGHQEFVNNWNAFSSLKYDDVLKEAAKGGYQVKFTFAATLMGGSTYVMLNTLGSTFSANMAGEIRGVQKSQLLSLFGALAIQMCLWFSFYQMAYTDWGSHWTNALMYLFGSGSKSYPLWGEPFATVMVAFMSASPVLVVLVAIGFFMGTFGSAAGLGFGPTRNLFAWSFDRILPEKFSEVNRKWRSPLWIVWICVAAGWIFMMMDIWQPTWTADIGYTITAWFAAWIFFGIAGIVFPFRRKEMFENAPPLVKSRLFGIPVISILGALTTLVSTFVVCYMLIPYFNGTMPVSVWVMTISFFVIPIVIYFVSKTVHAKNGISLDKQFREIPPE